MNKQTEALKMAMETMEATLLVGQIPTFAIEQAIQSCKEAIEQEERTQRTMHCGTADAFIAMDDDHKRRWFVQSLRESKRRKELEDILEQPAQEPVAWYGKDTAFPNGNKIFVFNNKDDANAYGLRKSVSIQPLYTHPASSWQGLSDDEIQHLKYEYADYTLYDEGDGVCPEVELEVEGFARAIEAKLKEKNQ